MGTELQVMAIGGTPVISALDPPELDGVASRLALIAEEALHVEVDSDASYEIAVHYLNQIEKIFSVVEEIIERFRKPAYDYYQSVLKEKRDILQPGDDARLVLRLKISDYHRKKTEAAEAERTRLLEAAKDDILQEVANAAAKALETGDTDEAKIVTERLASIVADATAIVEAADVEAAPEVKGITFRDKWSATLKEPEDESLRLLCAAIAERKAPLNLVRFERVEANKLARALKDELQIPGIAVHSGSTLVKKRG